jgi:hypothetical protein
MHKSATKCNETQGKWCKNKHGASKIIDTFETYQAPDLSPTVLRHGRLVDGKVKSVMEVPPLSIVNVNLLGIFSMLHTVPRFPTWVYHFCV